MFIMDDKTNKHSRFRGITESVKALLVGINYRGTRNELSSCINYVLTTQKRILSEYPNASLELMTDDTFVKPTRDNILNRLKFLINASQAGDVLIFYYSGYCGPKKDFGSKEKDSIDQIICPIDFTKPMNIIAKGVNYKVNSNISDDEIHEIISHIPKRVKFLMLSDCCRLGTIGELKKDFSSCFQPLVLEKAETITFGVGTSYSYDQRTSNHKNYLGTNKCVLNMKSIVICKGGELRIISGCEEDQTSADTGRNGACTNAFWETVINMGGLDKFFIKLFSHHVEDLKYIQDCINWNLSKFGFTQYSVISWDHVEAATRSFNSLLAQPMYAPLYANSRVLQSTPVYNSYGSDPVYSYQSYASTLLSGQTDLLERSRSPVVYRYST